MLRLLSDEDFNGRIVRGLLLRLPDLDPVRVQDVGLSGAADPDVLAWAAAQDRVVLSHDRQTMVGFAYALASAGVPMAGVFLVDDHAPIGRAIDQLEFLAVCSSQEEWRDQVVFLPS